ncbi:hypothetical protein ACLK19_22400 [Escherichia coli]
MDSVVRSMEVISTTSHRSFPHPSHFQRVPTVDTSNPFAAKRYPVAR